MIHQDAEASCDRPKRQEAAALQRAILQLINYLDSSRHAAKHRRAKLKKFYAPGAPICR
jgi:hypothetical protein